MVIVAVCHAVPVVHHHAVVVVSSLHLLAGLQILRSVPHRQYHAHHLQTVVHHYRKLVFLIQQCGTLLILHLLIHVSIIFLINQIKTTVYILFKLVNSI